MKLYELDFGLDYCFSFDKSDIGSTCNKWFYSSYSSEI